LAYSLLSYFFPGYAVTRTILDALLDLFYQIFQHVDHLYVTRIVSPEYGGAQLQTHLTINASTQINYWNLHCAVARYPLSVVRES